MRTVAGSRAQLLSEGRLLTKVGHHPVVVFWHDDRAWAIEDRCPHMGFPLRRGTVEDGLVTCHWHHARFDLASGCTLDPFADDAIAFDVDIEGDEVVVSPRPRLDQVAHLTARLRDGLEDNLTLVVAKSVLGLLDSGVAPSEIVRVGVDFGTTYRSGGWSAGLTVLVAMTNLLPELSPDDRGLALVHGLAFVARDTQGRPPRFALDAMTGGDVPVDRLAGWYRRFIETRSEESAERVLATALASGASPTSVEAMMMAAVTDHVFIDDGHTIDFTNKAWEAVAHLGESSALAIVPTLVHQTAHATRSEESGTWRHPHDLAAVIEDLEHRLPALLAAGAANSGSLGDKETAALAWRFLDDDHQEVVGALVDALSAGATPEQLGRAVALAAALRITRFHTRNDFGDWDTVHHAFTAANALHQALVRTPTPELVRGVIHGALAVHLDRFLNIPSARLPSAAARSLDELANCWETQGGVDEAGDIAYGWLLNGGDAGALIATLGHALLAEDAGFHWYQVVEAGVRQFHAWPKESEEAALILAGVSRFLAAHTPTRRVLPTVVAIARRLRRGEALYDE